MNLNLKNWWQFSRPHTMIGSFTSITALYFITCAETSRLTHANTFSQIVQHLPVYLITLFSGLCCNLFIVGINQVQDVEIDRINKPWLPLAAGTIAVTTAKKAVIASLLISIISAALLDPKLALLSIIICAIGAAYSLPPFYLKKHHLPAAFAIVSVRGLLVNLGLSAHYMLHSMGKYKIPISIWPLALFVVGFSFGIAWFKDIPDTQGDELFHVKTIAVSMSRKTALWLGVTVVNIAYLLVAISPFILELHVQRSFFTTAHLLIATLFTINAAKLNLNNTSAVKRFYMFFWGLFFLEYVLYSLSFFI